jgi:acyl-CoA hydrolase
MTEPKRGNGLSKICTEKTMEEPEIKPKPVRASLTQVSDLTGPADANINCSIFGGVILAMVDKAAAVCAMRHAEKPCVTVAMERVEFLVPIHIGDYVIVEAHVNFTGKSSMEIGVEVYAENLSDGTRRHTNSCLVTMVALTPEGKPAFIPPLSLESPEEKKRFEEALSRYQQRRQK